MSGQERKRGPTGRWQGTTLGSYELQEELARGGMGAVWRAWDRGAGRDVAVKLLLAVEPGPQDDLRRKRVLREARTLARLRHPHVVTVHDAGEVLGVPWVAMELVQGESLEARLAREGRLPLGETAALGAKLARALAYAHGQSVLHRDLKPANVLVRALDGEPLLTDFGLAQDLARDASRLSQTGSFLGTPQYWPPEQAQGDLQRIGPWSDVYGLGATLYHLVTGRAPHEGASLQALVDAAAGKKTPVRALRREVGAELAGWIERCLSSDPAARPGLGELADALERLARLPDAGGGGRRGPLVAGVAAGALALAALLLGATLLLLEPGARARERAGARGPEPGPEGATSTIAPQPPEASTTTAALDEDPFALPAGWEALALDAALLNDPARHPALQVFSPWGVRLDPAGGLRLAALGEDRPELRLPIELGGDPWRLRLQVAVQCADPGTGLAVALQVSPEARVQAPLLLLVLAGGDPSREDELLFSAGTDAELPLHQVEVGPPTGRPDLTLLLDYGGRDDPRLRLGCRSRSDRVEQELELGSPLPAAEWQLRVGTNLVQASAQALATVHLWVARCELQLPRGAWREARVGAGYEPAVGRLGRAWARGALEEVAATASDLGVKAVAAGEGTWFPPASLLGGLALARLGRDEEAVTLLSSLQKAGALERDMLSRGSWYEGLAWRALPQLGAAERLALARTWVRALDPPPADLRARGRALLAEGSRRRALEPAVARGLLARAALLLLSVPPAGGELELEDRRDLADVWLQLGDPEGALGSLGDDPSPAARLTAGLAAFRLGRWSEAVRLLEAVPPALVAEADRPGLARTIARARSR